MIIYLNRDIFAIERHINCFSREFLLITVNVFFSKEIHSLFPYWVNNNKFNWGKLRLKFQNMANSNLKEVIVKIRDVLESD